MSSRNGQIPILVLANRLGFRHNTFMIWMDFPGNNQKKVAVTHPPPISPPFFEYLPYVASSSICLIFKKILTKPMYFNIVFYNKHLQTLLQKRKKTHNIMMNFLGTSAMIIQTIFKASRNFIFIPPLSIAEQNLWGAPGGHRHNQCLFSVACVHHIMRLACG